MLTIDIGNSRVKWALFDANNIIQQDAFAYEKDRFSHALLAQQLPIHADTVVIGNVAGKEIENELVHYLAKEGCEKYTFARTHAMQCGVKNGYENPASLGVDRWLAMIAAFQSADRQAGHGVCVIDCGTAVTVDIVDNNGQHLGGYIAPGYRTMRTALSQNASGIDASDIDGGNVASLVPASSTEDALQRGCLQFLLGGVQAMLKQSLDMATPLDVFVTGGGATKLLAAIQTDLKVVYEPMLVNRGLQYLAIHDE